MTLWASLSCSHSLFVERGKKRHREAQNALPRWPSAHCVVSIGGKQVIYMLVTGPRKGPRQRRLLTEAKAQAVLYGAGRGVLKTVTFFSDITREV